MEAIILAGGFGTRLNNVLKDLPKSMAPIKGIPFLSYLLDQLQNQGFTKVVMAVGYMHQKISSYYGDMYKMMKLEYSVENEPLGTGGCVKKAISKTTDKYIFVINGDTFFNINFSKIIKPINVLIACKKMNNSSRYGSICLEGRIIRKFSEKGENGSGYINGGIYYLSRNIFNKFEMPDKFSIERDFFEKHLTELSIETYLSDDYFIDIGIPEDYDRAQKEMK